MSKVIIENLSKSFGETVVLPDFNLTVEEGEFVVLLGPSGCGKTTVLRCLAGLEAPTGGRISIGPQVVDDVTAAMSTPTQKRNLGLVFQSYALWPHMSVFENVAYPLRMRKLPKSRIAEKVAEILTLVGLEEYATRSSMELSGGQQQRVALARALIASPQLLLLDEPLSNLDAQRRNALRKQLRAIHQSIGTTTVYVTHDQVEALTMADRVLVMRGGRVEQAGTPQAVFERPRNAFVADFLGYENIIDGRVVAAGDGSVVVEIDGGIRLRTSAAGSLANAAGAGAVGFRAVNVTLHPDTEEMGENAFVVRVEDITYLGDSLEVTVASGGRTLVARVSVASLRFSGALSPGDSLVARIAAENVVVLESDLRVDSGASNRHQH